MEAATKAAEATGTGGGGGGGGIKGDEASSRVGHPEGAASAPLTLESNSEFYNTGRVGRRNALPDILNHHHSKTSTADLPDKLSALSTTGEF